MFHKVKSKAENCRTKKSKDKERGEKATNKETEARSKEKVKKQRPTLKEQ